MNRNMKILLITGLLIAVCLLNTGCNSRGQYVGIGGVLDDMMPPTPKQAAQDAFNIYDPDTRRNAINLLSNAPWGGEPPYLRTYRLQINDPDPTVRAACVAALGRHGTTEDVPLILVYLRDDARIVRWEATKALQRIHYESAVDPLIDRAKTDPMPDVRQAAVNALAQYHQRKVFDTLIGALNDSDYAVVTEAGKALDTVTGQDFHTDGSKWLAWAKQKNNTDLFAEAKTYYYPQYQKPSTLIERAEFWKEAEKIEPKQPRGFDEDA